MIAVEHGLSILLNRAELLAFLDGKAKGSTRLASSIGVEVAVCIGDITDLTPAAAGVLAAALRANAMGDAHEGPLNITAGRILSVLHDAEGVLPAYDTKAA